MIKNWYNILAYKVNPLKILPLFLRLPVGDENSSHHISDAVCSWGSVRRRRWAIFKEICFHYDSKEKHWHWKDSFGSSSASKQLEKLGVKRKKKMCQEAARPKCINVVFQTRKEVYWSALQHLVQFRG